MWASAGWETIYKPATATLSRVPEASLLRLVEDGRTYGISEANTFSQYTEVYIVLKAVPSYRIGWNTTMSAGVAIGWNTAPVSFVVGDAGRFIGMIREWHNAS